jgi:hypothetical protein
MTDNSQISPDTFWKDEEGIEEHYCNVYVAIDKVKSSTVWYEDLDDNVIEWLNTNAGNRRAHGLEWYQNLELDRYDWSVRGTVRYKGQSCIQILIKDKRAAMMFKLSWGGL